MIIFRYLIREILITMGAIAAVLLLVIMGNQFIGYINDAADGDFPINLVSTLMLYQVPSFLQLILPMAFFLGYLMAYGQLYLNYEMIVMQACGFSPMKLLSYALWPGMITALIVAACSLWLTPIGLHNNAVSMNTQSSRLDFSVITPGRFQDIGHHRTVYVSKMTNHGTQIQNIYVLDTQPGKTSSVIRAETGSQFTDSQQGNRYLRLSNGFEYKVTPGQGNAEVSSFDHYYRIIQRNTAVDSDAGPEQMSTGSLLTEGGSQAIGEIQYRISLVLMVPILALLGISLSRLNPRQGRFAKLLPALLLYIVYVSLIIAAKDTVQSGKLPAMIGIWPVHILFLLLGLWLAYRTYGTRGKR